MLLENSPQLECLVLNGRQDHLWRISRVSEGRWPTIRKLSLGYHTGGINNHPPFREFLSAHPLLRDITLTGLRFEPWDVSEETSLLDLPAVEVYTGFWPIHRSTIAYPMYTSIKSVTAYHVMWIPSSWMMTTVFPTLKKKLPSLTSLSMSVEFRSRVGVTTLDFFRSLFNSCPSLTHLELLSSSHFDLVSLPSFYLNSDSYSITGGLRDCVRRGAIACHVYIGQSSQVDQRGHDEERCSLTPS